MTDLQAMKLAIEEARKCEWPEEQLDYKPSVGAVITLANKLVASAHRAEHEHAEKLVISKVPAGRDLTKATVWTTLEPCTHGVRSREQESCTDRLIARHVKRVMIGILDPNAGVCGKGVLALQEAGVEVGLFPHKLAEQIRGLNERFIRAQKSLGIKITSLHDGDTYSMGNLTIRGTYVNKPTRGVFAMTFVAEEDSLGLGGGWRPQDQVRALSDSEDTWEAKVQFGSPQRIRIGVVRASELGEQLINYYESLKRTREIIIHRVSRLYDRNPEDVRCNVAPVFWPMPLPWSLAKGLDLLAWVEIKIVEGDPRGSSNLVASGTKGEPATSYGS
jgi:pyrimidine deaminase RibD-like protein